MPFDPFIQETIRRALAEDVGNGDITSELIIDLSARSRAVFRAKESFVLAGMPFVQEVFHQVDPELTLTIKKKEGISVKRGDLLAEAAGRTRSLLMAERTALNILQRVSGIATLTRQFVEAVKGTGVRITDTRKTTPGFRSFEKYGVRIGGGWNHRFGLYDGVLIKDNHIAAAGGIAKAIDRTRRAHHLLNIEVEVSSLKEVEEALNARADVIMLDNMDITDIRRAVAFVGKRALLEVSGGVSLATVADLAATGVDIISSGALTHSARAVDISMKIVRKG
ncbi:MAG: carboxylating nicotinate-nucleotide diphosphorylase [Nitrospiraceae bacterium]|jgi:nicotinate-nucleotide pyrophosphorylase (carboxylating)|nr:carboxylating nicotinate-nucleotide diphosphorylase [Nitrospiraceae bacterium]